MIKKKTLIALLMASAMAVTACGQAGETTGSSSAEESKSQASNQDSSASQEETSYFNATGFPIVNEEITLKIFTYKNPSSTMDYEDMPGWQYLSELTGINFEIEECAPEDMATRLSLMLANPDEMPDIIWQYGFGPLELNQYGGQGFFLDMSDLIEQYGENIKKCWETEDSSKIYATSNGGAIYGLPGYNYSGDPTGVWTCQVNNRWMENCGITEYPKTVEELKEMLITFRDMDANGNGDPNDEIPMLAASSSCNLWQIFGGYFDMNLYWPWEGVVYGSFNGSTEVVPYFMTDNYRAMIEYWNELYDEKLIDQDLYSISAEEVNAKRAADIYGVLPNIGIIPATEKYDPDDFTAIPLLGSEYREDTSYALIQPDYQPGMGVICANTKYPEACIRLLDYFMSADGSALIHTVPHDGTYDLAAAGVSQEVIDMYADAMASGISSAEAHPNVIGAQGNRWKYQFAEYKSDQEFANNAAKTYQELWDSLKGKEVYNYIPYLNMTEEEQEVVSVYKTDIDGYVKEVVAQWFIGETELNDQTWNAYIEQLNDMGVDKLTKVYQDANNRYLGLE